MLLVDLTLPHINKMGWFRCALSIGTFTAPPRSSFLDKAKMQILFLCPSVSWQVYSTILHQVLDKRAVSHSCEWCQNGEACLEMTKEWNLSLFPIPSFYLHLRRLAVSSCWWFIMQVWGLLIAVAHERGLSFPLRWLQIKPEPISSSGWGFFFFLLWLKW